MIHVAAAGGHARLLARVLAPRRLLVLRLRRWSSSPLASSSSSPLTTLQRRLASVPLPSSRRHYFPIAIAATASRSTRIVATTADAIRPAARDLAPAAPPLADESAVRGPPRPPPLTLYDSMARTKRAFEARPGGDPVSMYVCGVTVYDLSHVGHARVYCAADVLFRFLRRSGHAVRYVRNFTDIDDKIINRAKESREGEEASSSSFDVAAACSSLTERMIAEFHDDVDALRCLRPTSEPRATAFVPEMIAMISDILAAGHAYVAPLSGDVMFSVEGIEGYGRLSGRTTADNRAGERVAVDGNKRNPADFVLWKSAKPGEPAWESPWGPGRPGWHIECSAMARALLGPVVDVHGGGADLMHPHHDNEIAQCQASAEVDPACSCCGDGKGASAVSSAAAANAASPPSSSSQSGPVVDFVRYWCHYGFVNVDSQKMSKSLGNFFTIRDARSRYSAPALRFFLLGTHYRSPLNFSHEALENAADRLFYVYSTLADVEEELEALRAKAEAEGKSSSNSSASDAAPAAAPAAAAAAPKKGKATPVSISDELSEADRDLDLGKGPGGEALANALASLADDVGTPGAVAALSAPLKQANDLLKTKAGKKAAWRAYSLASIAAGSQAVLELLGLEPRPDAKASLEELKDAALLRCGVTREEVARGIDERAAARAAKDWAAADAVRVRLEAVGIAISDTAGGETTWRPVARVVGGESEGEGGSGSE